MARQLRLDLGRSTPFRRADFVVSAAASDALGRLDTWPNWLGGALALVGPAGSGKSHLALAWAACSRAAVIQGGAKATVNLPRLEGRPVLIEDADRGVADELLFHLINMAATRAAGSCSRRARAPAAWPAALPDLRSRLNALPVAELPVPDDAVLEAALAKFFRERNIKPAGRPDSLPPAPDRAVNSAGARGGRAAGRDGGCRTTADLAGLGATILENGETTGDLFD